MFNKYFNVEIRVDNIQDLVKIQGKPGRRVLVSNTNTFYFWNSIDKIWKVESPGTGYKCYSCELFQSGTNTLWDNVYGTHTFEDFVFWERLSVGVYRGTLINGFPDGRTMLIYNGVVQKSVYANTSPPSTASFSFVSIENTDVNTLIIYQTDSVTLQPIDGLNRFNLEIRVYNENQYRD